MNQRAATMRCVFEDTFDGFCHETTGKLPSQAGHSRYCMVLLDCAGFTALLCQSMHLSHFGTHPRPLCCRGGSAVRTPGSLPMEKWCKYTKYTKYHKISQNSSSMLKDSKSASYSSLKHLAHPAWCHGVPNACRDLGTRVAKKFPLHEAQVEAKTAGINQRHEIPKHNDDILVNNSVKFCYLLLDRLEHARKQHVYNSLRLSTKTLA